jgi:ABC-type multidrug transport system permease subunit
MSDEPKKLGQRPPFPWAAAALVVAMILSYCGLIAFILLNHYTSVWLLFIWFAGTAITFRLGMRVLKKRYENALPR